MDIFIKPPTAIPDAPPIPLPNDYLIDVRLLDSATGAVILDCSGAAAVKMSDLLLSLSEDQMTAFVSQTAVEMLLLSRGLATDV